MEFIEYLKTQLYDNEARLRSIENSSKPSATTPRSGASQVFSDSESVRDFEGTFAAE